VPEREYDKRRTGQQSRAVLEVQEGRIMNENYQEYLTAYTEHHNLQSKIYGGNPITESEAEKHAIVREVKDYYETLAGVNVKGNQ